MSVDKIVNEIENQANTSVDPTTAGVDSITLREVTSILTRVTSVLLGWAIAIIVIGVPIIIALEVAYITFPLVRSGMDKVAFHLDKIITKGVAKKTVEITFRDARQALLEAETKATGRSATWIYLRIKTKSVMFIVFIISLVGLGSGTFINITSKSFSGIFGLIRDFVGTVVK